MRKPATPEGRIERWKKLWGGVRTLSSSEAEEAYEEFVEEFVPGHMEKKFRQFFGTPRAKFGNRFFRDDAVYHTWNTSFSSLGLRDATHVEATILYSSPEDIEGHVMRGEVRRTLKDLLVDDWHAACAMVRAEEVRLYLFIEPKMRGCIVLRLTEEESE